MRLRTVKTMTAPTRPMATPSTACSRLAKRLVSSLNPPDRERARAKVIRAATPRKRSSFQSSAVVPIHHISIV